jgi:hypothetical protein
VTPLTLRRWHAYVGLFTAPTVLLFTLTGAVQLFNWHEAHGSYRPPELLEQLSSLHKDQVLKREEEEKREEAETPHEEKRVPLPTFALKSLFFIVAIAVTVSTCFGVWMGLTQIPRKGLSIGLLAAGTLLPLTMIAL